MSIDEKILNIIWVLLQGAITSLISGFLLKILKALFFPKERNSEIEGVKWFPLMAVFSFLSLGFVMAQTAPRYITNILPFGIWLFLSCGIYVVLCQTILTFVFKFRVSFFTFCFPVIMIGILEAFPMVFKFFFSEIYDIINIIFK